MTFTEYCAAVCAQVRWKRARDGIAAELTAHLVDHAAALMEEDAPQEEAQARALAAMGDPEELGRAFDKLYSPFWYALEALLRYLWLLALAALAVILLWTTDWSALLPAEKAADGSALTERLIAGLRDVDELEPAGASSAWWSGRFGRLDHAVLVSGECFLFPDGEGTYTFAFRLYDISCSPFLDSRFLGDWEDCITFSTPAGESFPTLAYSDALGCSGLTPDVRVLSVTCSFLGRRCRWDIPLEWGDAP